MNRNTIMLALAVGLAVYIWKDSGETDPGPALASPDPQSRTTAQTENRAEKLLEEARREREELQRLKEEMELERLNAELDARIAEQRSREQEARAREQARRERQLQEWKRDFNDRAERRDAWEDYNASKDAVTGVAKDEHWNISDPDPDPAHRHDHDALIELPKQQLQRRYGDSAALEQNELQ
ncbi:MAG TPA: hypothetical protein VK973_13535 [Arenicellales bacterium]|nr:hypothetical protein [Arenicellales bacterium]